MISAASSWAPPDFAVPTLQALADSGAQIVGVYTQPDRPSGRGKKTTKFPVKVLAEALGLPIFQPATLSTTEARSELEALRPDAIVIAAYGLILPDWTLALPTHGALNVHPSLLPRHRGPAPVANAILEGDQETGVTIMLVEPEVDSGPILRTAKVPISLTETTGQLTEKMSIIGGELLVETLRDWTAGLIDPQPQDPLSSHLQPQGNKDRRPDRLDASCRSHRPPHPRLPPVARLFHNLVRPKAEDLGGSPHR